MFQEPAEDRAHPDVVGQARYPGTQRADAADHQVHLDPGAAGPVQRVDDLLVDECVHLDLHAGVAALQRMLDLPLDPLDDARPYPVRRDEQPPVRGLPAVPRQHVEQVGQVGADLRVGGQQPVVLVEPGGARVVVAGADVCVPPDLVALLPDHQRGLAVRLQPDQAVDHVAAGLLVEARLDLDEHHHLLAGLGGVDERVDDRRVAGGAVQRLLDGQHVRVGGGLLDEPLHARVERVVRVVYQDVAVA